jgi:hypothetical protein
MVTPEQLGSGSICYVPFWTLLNYLDAAPPDPFVKCKLIRHSKTEVVGKDGKREYVDTCSIDVYPNTASEGLNIVHDMPMDFLIVKDQLSEWSNRLCTWFNGYVEKELT